MSVSVVSIFANLVTPKDVTFQITPENAVSGLKAVLLQRNGPTDFEQLKKWNSTQLKNGVTFTVEGPESLQIVLTATVTATTFLTASNAFDPNPPANQTKKVTLKNNEGVIERLWLYLPK
jgi:hypothetical protein